MTFSHANAVDEEAENLPIIPRAASLIRRNKIWTKIESRKDEIVCSGKLRIEMKRIIKVAILLRL
jgi:hypothetical protein